MAQVDYEESLNSFFKAHKPGRYEQLEQYCQNFDPTPATIKLLADACRIPEWRGPLREAGFLAAMLEILSLDAPPAQSLQILRFVGNCCFDEGKSQQFLLSLGSHPCPVSPKL
jgi:hypothetical protein